MKVLVSMPGVPFETEIMMETEVIPQLIKRFASDTNIEHHTFVVIDYITGVMCAINDRTLSSEVGFKGICRKVLIFLLVGIAHILDVNVIGSGGVLRTAVIFFYISNEGVSLLENAAHLGLPVPEKIKVVLEQLHDRSESKEE